MWAVSSRLSGRRSRASRTATACTPTAPSVGTARTPKRRCATARKCIRWRISLSFAQGAAIGTPYGTAWRALFDRARAQPGETLLVHGASGGVGIAATQLARAYGMRVIGTAGTEKGAALVRTQGAHEVLNHREAGYWIESCRSPVDTAWT